VTPTYLIIQRKVFWALSIIVQEKTGDKKSGCKNIAAREGARGRMDYAVGGGNRIRQREKALPSPEIWGGNPKVPEKTK